MSVLLSGSSVMLYCRLDCFCLHEEIMQHGAGFATVEIQLNMENSTTDQSPLGGQHTYKTYRAPMAKFQYTDATQCY